MDKIIYMDNAATTMMEDQVFQAMKPYFQVVYANPSSGHGFAARPKQAIRQARQDIAAFVNARPNEIYFTSGGSESVNWAIKGFVGSNKGKGNHIITSKIEHHAVLNTCHQLEKEGFEVTYLDVDEYGSIGLDQLKAAIKDTTILISIMFANNEIGTIEPIREIGAIAREHNVVFHTDAIQAYGHVAIDVRDLNIDMLSASAHKCGGPKGVGLLYVKSGIEIGSLIHGGHQEQGKRAGTLNVPGIVGFHEATKLAGTEMTTRVGKIRELRDYLIAQVLDKIELAYLNGSPVSRLPNNAHFCFDYVEGESLVVFLEQVGICASSGAACESDSIDPSHVVLAIGRDEDLAYGSLRLSISERTTKDQVDYVVAHLTSIVEKLKKMSPLYQVTIS